MKRVKAACICQTLCFFQKEETSREAALTFARREVADYKKGLERNQTKYKIVEETEAPEGAIYLKIIKQYNASPVGDYLD